MHSVPAVYIYNMTDKVKNILKYRLDFCKIMLKSIVGSLRRMGCPRFPLPPHGAMLIAQALH